MARALAALAIVAAVVGLILVVSNSSLDGDDDGKQENEQTQSSCQPPDEEAVRNGYYVLEAGEGLSDVAAQTCIPLDQLIELNPNLDPQELPVGGCVDLIVDGCKALAQG